MSLKANHVYEGDCLDVMKQLPDNCIDTIITDPPYSINFMNKDWDNEIAFNPAVWAECLRVAKPGATLMAFGGTRTYHRLACAIEDADWEIRDCVSYFHDGSQAERALMASLNDEQLAAYLELHYPNGQCHWVYGSGFPKSLDIGKAIDKAAIIECLQCSGDGIGNRWLEYYCPEHGKIEDGGSVCHYDDCNEGAEYTEEYDLCSSCNGTGKVKGAERDVVGEKIRLGDKKAYPRNQDTHNQSSYALGGVRAPYSGTGKNTAPSTPLAQDFDGWGTALKPSFEPIILAMKPIDKNYAYNAEKWGVSGLNIDGARIPTDGESLGRVSSGIKSLHRNNYEQDTRPNFYYEDQEPRLIDNSNGRGRYPANTILDGSEEVEKEFAKAPYVQPCGGPKKTNHNTGMFGVGQPGQIYNNENSNSPSRYFQHCPPDEPARLIYQAKAPQSERSTPGNNHPTQKPLSLLKYLCRLTRTPDNGIVLDPFAGSGTTALACIAENRDYILIEKEGAYIEIIKRRIAEFIGQDVALKEVEIAGEIVKQMSLW
jgi:DNA modification methylase